MTPITEETWEEALPIVPAEHKPAKVINGHGMAYVPQATGRSPHSEEAERHILGCILLDGEFSNSKDTLLTAVNMGLSSGSFYSERNRLTFQICRQLLERDELPSTVTLVEELKLRRQLEAVGGMAYIMEVTSGITTTTHAKFFIKRVLQDSANRKEVDRARTVIERAEKGEDVGVEVGPTQPIATVRPITSYAYPSEDDPNTLLGNDDYLGRGGGMLFVSHAGAGKSSWIMDACMMWAIGRPWMGIKCNGPLKSLIIQAEDSDRYIGKIFASFAHVNRLTADELSLLSKNCTIVRLKGVSGAAFERELSELTTAHTPDLVIINPVYLYADGDISRSEFAQPFLVGLDRVNKAEKFAYILIHHTGKPSKQQNGKRAELDDWESAYMGFGSSYFANWPRCTALLEPIPTHQGRYLIKLGKGGLNAGITKQVEQGAGTRQEPVTRIAIKHSTERMPVNGKDKPVYYWEMDDTPPESGASTVTKKSGRPQKYEFSQIADIFPTPNEPGRTFPVLLSYARSKIGIGETALRSLVNDAVRDGQVILSKSSTGYVHHLNLPVA